MLYTIASVMTILVGVIILLAAWVYGDWRNWKKYYPTIIYIISVDLLITVLMYDYPLWHFEKTLFIPNHTLADFFICFVNFPPMMILYLSRFPFSSGFLKQSGYILLWTTIFSLVELMFHYMGLTSYHNGWTYWWSVIVWVFLFIGTRLHHTRPLWAWVLTFVMTLFLIFHFEIPVTTFK
ncbi:CBO0543 family protein [Brevibacillus dissolubilis]|uniref:CBO0543 family protein n=1 Tax=Brevibacillus dissolubilis TaxID=1844116 RepID=UPI00159BB339|nr:CBO0543 family protein [Brevibacillus dissolubilis]